MQPLPIHRLDLQRHSIFFSVSGDSAAAPKGVVSHRIGEICLFNTSVHLSMYPPSARCLFVPLPGVHPPPPLRDIPPEWRYPVALQLFPPSTTRSTPPSSEAKEEGGSQKAPHFDWFRVFRDEAIFGRWLADGIVGCEEWRPPIGWVTLFSSVSFLRRRRSNQVVRPLLSILGKIAFFFNFIIISSFSRPDGRLDRHRSRKYHVIFLRNWISLINFAYHELMGCVNKQKCLWF